MSIGDRLKQIREDKGLRQIDVAKELEISQSYISDVENNRTIPNKRFLKLFCLQFGVNKNWILDSWKCDDGQTGWKEVCAMDKEQLSKVQELCRPISEYLQCNSDPYTEVCISQNGIVVKQSIAGLPNEVAADKDANCLVH